MVVLMSNGFWYIFPFIITCTNIGSSLPISVGTCTSMKAFNHSVAINPTDKHGIGVFGRTKSYDVMTIRGNITITQTSTKILQPIHYHCPTPMGRTHIGRGTG